MLWVQIAISLNDKGSPPSSTNIKHELIDCVGFKINEVFI